MVEQLPKMRITEAASRYIVNLATDEIRYCIYSIFVFLAFIYKMMNLWDQIIQNIFWQIDAKRCPLDRKMLQWLNSFFEDEECSMFIDCHFQYQSNNMCLFLNKNNSNVLKVWDNGNASLPICKLAYWLVAFRKQVAWHFP